MSEQTETPVTLAALPKVGETLATGTFAGIITQQDGTHVAVILLPNQEILNRYVTLAYNKEKLTESHPAKIYLIVPTI
jgi:hypothetical protein